MCKYSFLITTYSIKSSFLLVFLIAILPFDGKAQSRYSFGTNYTFLLHYPIQDYKKNEFVIQLGIAGTREISLRSSIILGINYYQSNMKIQDSSQAKIRYLEIPLSLKTNFSIFEKTVRGHLTSGIGLNMRISRVESKLKSEPVNAILGLGVDIRIHKGFYLTIDALAKAYYLIDSSSNKKGDKIVVIPVTGAGIFVWLNRGN